MVVQLRLPGMLTLSGITVACPESTNMILPLNVANYLDPTTRSDMELTVRKASADIATTVTWLNAIQGNGLLDIGSAQALNPSGPLGGGVTIFNNGGVVTNPFGGGVTIGGTNPIGNGGLIGGGAGAGAAGGAGDITSYDTSAQGQFNSRISIISEYCEKYGNIVDIDKIRSEYADDPEAGVEYCDDIINNQLDQDLLRKMIHKKYEAYNKSKQEAGKAVADDWVKAVLEAGLNSPQISAGVNGGNVLEVIGAFSTNKEVKNGKVSMDNVMESPEITLQIIEAIKSRADKMLTDPDVEDSKKEQIADKIRTLRVNYDKYQDSISDDDRHNDVEFRQVRSQLAKDVMDLFAIIRLDEAERTDEIAPQYYGLPENSSITFDDRTKMAQEEISSYRNRRRLSTTM